MAATETPRAEQVTLELMAERMDALEAEVAALRADTQRKIANAQKGTRPPAQAKEPGKGRWLDSARFANACQGTCGGRVQKGERAWYVPNVGVYHEACAPRVGQA